MKIEQILRDVGLILGAGLVAQFLATVTRIPEMIPAGRSGHGHQPLLADGAEIAVSLVALAVCSTLLLQARRLGLI